jgi:DUF4097 and DUF4098 domain-containing protein YvlB
MKPMIKYLIIIFSLLLVNICLGQTKTRTFKGVKGGSVEVSISVGDIIIKVSENDELVVKYELDDDREGRGREGVKISQSGNNFIIKSSGEIPGGDKVEISVPFRVNLNLRTNAGDIYINNLIEGSVKAATSGGDIKIKDIKGILTAATGGGDIHTGSVTGDVGIKSSGGDLRIGSIGGNAALSTTGGNIRVEEVKKDAKLYTAGGNITIGNVGANLSVKTAGGNIKTGLVKGVVDAITSGGNIEISESEGNVTAKTFGGNIRIKSRSAVNAITNAGDINLTLLSLNGDLVDLKASYGDVNITIPSNIRASVLAETGAKSWGSDDDIRSDFKEEISTDTKFAKSFLREYKINGGGKPIMLKTNSGTIRIKKEN